MSKTIKSLSLACRVIMDLHALNNEGSESNRLMTRQVGIVTPTADDQGEVGYQRSVVNAISGDMNKHIFAEAFRDIALDLNLPLCQACQALDPARMMGNEEFRDFVKTKPSVEQVIDRLLTCALDDVCGIMITGEGTSVKRKSAAEFGWTVGIPGITEVQEFIHARHAITRLTRTKAVRGDKESKDQALEEKEQNIGQMIFNRPASSGVYAFVAHLDVAAIGFNDASQVYPEKVKDRDTRLRAALLAMAQTVLHPKGALTSTQLPHVVGIQGYVSLSTSAAAAPLISPLMEDFEDAAEKTAAMLNKLHGDSSVEVGKFDSGEGLLNAMGYVLNGFAPGVYRRG